jgi:NADH:ubiquinone oxidoreductase subunit E
MKQLDKVLAPYQGERGAMIPALQAVQEKLGYISEDAVTLIARLLNVSPSEVFGVATFYAQFRFTPPGEHTVKVCLGTACHVRGGEEILDNVSREVGVRSGETSKDGKFSLERVACFGSCALAPVMVVDKDVYGRLTIQKAKGIIAQYRDGRGKQ